MRNKIGEWLDSPNRWTLEIYLWVTATVLVFILSILFPRFWAIISIVYLAVVSNYALVLTAAGARQAALARIAAGNDNPSTKEIMEYLVAHTNLQKEVEDDDRTVATVTDSGSDIEGNSA